MSPADAEDNNEPNCDLGLVLMQEASCQQQAEDWPASHLLTGGDGCVPSVCKRHWIYALQICMHSLAFFLEDSAAN